jgi:hypothetical protein
MGTLGSAAEPDTRDDELGEEEIVERIFEAIIDQRLPPGTKLSEAALCEAFGVGGPSSPRLPPSRRARSSRRG